MNEEHKIDQVIGMIKAGNDDIKDALTNLEAIKGKAFADTVKLSVSLFKIMQICVTVPESMRKEIIPMICASFMHELGSTLLNGDVEAFKETIKFSKQYSERHTEIIEHASKIIT